MADSLVVYECDTFAEFYANLGGLYDLRMRMTHRSENYRFANTNSYLLVVTMVVSVLHMIFEYLALKHDAPWHARHSISRQNKPKTPCKH